MNLEKIELLGFKSFADKTEIKLTDGVTGIVGPNGCGKSNVSDAIRWVLGEQSAKQLRGSNMQDVIFNGTEKRKSLSYCEVSLYFNNEDGKLFPGLEYQDVVFTRKLYRSGESEYYINKKRALMRDIVDCLHECGVSKEGYTIIGQGKVSEILSSKPEDRRSIFEEAIGIAKTKNKKLESERRLGRTRENIIRIIDKTTEIERILEPLSHQAEKTRTFRALSEELKYHEINTYLFKHDNASATKDKIKIKIKGFEEEIKNKNLDLEDVQRRYFKHTDEISLADKTMNELHEKILEKSLEAQRLTSNENISKQKISFFRQEVERLQKEIENNLVQIKVLTDQKNEKEKYVSLSQKETDKLNKRANDISKELQKLNNEISRDEERIQNFRSQVLKTTESLVNINHNIGSLVAEKNLRSGQQKETLQKVEDLIVRRNALAQEYQEVSRKVLSLERSISNKKDDIKDVEAEIAQTNKFIEEISNTLYRLNSDVTALETNYKIYSNLKESFGGYGQTVKNLMVASQKDKELASKIKGLVAQVIKTEQKFEVAVETALGGYTQNIITSTPDDAQWLFKYLKRINGGRINCLPMTSLKAREDGLEVKKATKEVGALGVATQIVKYSPEYQNVIKFLLGNTLVCDNVDNATAIAKKYGFAFKIVTLDGDLLSPSGTMSGGSRRQNTTNLLAMDRQLEETGKQLVLKRSEMQKLTANKDNLTNQVNELVENLNDLNQQLQEKRQEFASAKERLSAVEDNVKNVDGEIEKNKDVIALINTRINEIDSEYSEMESGNEQILKEKDSANQELSKETEIKKLQDKRASLVDENTEIQTKLAQLNTGIENAETDIKRIVNDMSLCSQVIEKNRDNISSDEKIIDALVKETEKSALSKEEKEAIDNLRAELQSYDEKKKALNDAVTEDNALRDQLSQEIQRLNERKFGEENALTRVDAELEYLQERIYTEYQETYETCKDKKDDNYDFMKGNDEINRLKKRISSLGSINANAIEDYEAQNAIYQDYMTQKADLEKAESDLKEAIGALTQEMTKTFDEGFEKIRENFKRIFKELFGGGKADLVLDYTDCVDPLDAGVEILAEPPGKKLQKISLLSGGEMALTAIAILFAILRLRPMPFCVLDEIEAALDDANVERFANYLKRFSEDTQFIVITHKKVTMEKADALHGVTMEEKGVSKTVSVKFADIDSVAL